MKQILKKEETRSKVISGINGLADIVKVTLGGKGKNVILNVGGAVQIINDGVSIAREVSFEYDPAKNSGALLAKQVAEKTNEEAGDGTTTSIVLLQAYVQALMETQTKDLRQFRDDVKVVLDKVVGELDKKKISIENPEEIERVAFISALNQEIAKTIREVFEETGKDGVISIESGRKPGISYEVVKGVRINEGLIINHLITHPDRQIAELEKTPVILSKKPLNTLSEILPLLGELAKKNFDRISIFTEEMSEEVLGFLVANKMQGIIQPLVVKTHDLDDIAIVTGASVITQENNLKFEEKNIGYAKKVTATKYHTTIIGEMTPEVIAKEVEVLKRAEANETEDFEKSRISRRIARLQGGVAIVRIAGDSEQETKEKKLKLEDALNAAKAAIEDGIIPGGGLALWRIGEIMRKPNNTEAEKIVIDTIQRPMIQILENAEENVEEILKRIGDFSEMGYNVVTRKTENFFESGVIDPVKVTKSALINAVTMGNMIATAEGAVVFTIEKPKE